MNVYADLGLPDADKMLVKAQRATKIAEIIKLRKLTQKQASTLIGMPQPMLSICCGDVSVCRPPMPRNESMLNCLYVSSLEMYLTRVT